MFNLAIYRINLGNHQKSGMLVELLKHSFAEGYELRHAVKAVPDALPVRRRWYG